MPYDSIDSCVFLSIIRWFCWWFFSLFCYFGAYGTQNHRNRFKWVNNLNVHKYIHKHRNEHWNTHRSKHRSNHILMVYFIDSLCKPVYIDWDTVNKKIAIWMCPSYYTNISQLHRVLSDNRPIANSCQTKETLLCFISQYWYSCLHVFVHIRSSHCYSVQRTMNMNFVSTAIFVCKRQQRTAC